MLGKALRRAQLAGHSHVRTASDLLRLRQQQLEQQQQQQGAADWGNGPRPAAVMAGFGDGAGLGSEDEDEDEDVGGAGGAERPAAVSRAGRRAVEAPEAGVAGNGGGSSPAGARAPPASGAASDGQEQEEALLADGCWGLPLAAAAVSVVCDAEGVQRVRAAIWGRGSSDSSTDADSRSSGGGGALGGGSSDGSEAQQQGVRPVVGLDCEWVPFERQQPRTPVSILQVGLPLSHCAPARGEGGGGGARVWRQGMCLG